jgi:hypothetical protein
MILMCKTIDPNHGESFFHAFSFPPEFLLAIGTLD